MDQYEREDGNEAESASPALRLYTVDELVTLPPPRWLIHRLFAEGAFVLLYGPTGIGKSFLLLDWGLSIATGRPWFGRPSLKGNVLFVAAENGFMSGRRAKAWGAARGVRKLDGAWFLPEPVQLAEADRRLELLHAVDRVKARVVIIDPLTDCSVGLDENLARDQSRIVSTVRALGHLRSRPAVILAHHTGVSTKRERGSTVLRSAADSAFGLLPGKKGRPIALRNVKQRDADLLGDIPLHLRSIAIDLPSGQEESCVFDPAGTHPPQATDGDAPSLDYRRAKPAIPTLVKLANTLDAGYSSGEWLKATGRANRTFYDHVRRLLEAGLVRQDGDRYFVTEAAWNVQV